MHYMTLILLILSVVLIFANKAIKRDTQRIIDEFARKEHERNEKDNSGIS